MSDSESDVVASQEKYSFHEQRKSAPDLSLKESLFHYEDSDERDSEMYALQLAFEQNENLFATGKQSRVPQSAVAKTSKTASILRAIAEQKLIMQQIQEARKKHGVVKRKSDDSIENIEKKPKINESIGRKKQKKHKKYEKVKEEKKVNSQQKSTPDAIPELISSIPIIHGARVQARIKLQKD